jgi:hypothetical protein
MIDRDERARELTELTEWDYALVDDPCYADLMAADGTRLCD